MDGRKCGACLVVVISEEGTISFYTSRHHYATMLITATGDLFTTSKLLGHTNIKTTQIYTDVVMEKLNNAVANLDGLF